MLDPSEHDTANEPKTTEGRVGQRDCSIVNRTILRITETPRRMSYVATSLWSAAAVKASGDWVIGRRTSHLILIEGFQIDRAVAATGVHATVGDVLANGRAMFSCLLNLLTKTRFRLRRWSAPLPKSILMCWQNSRHTHR